MTKSWHETCFAPILLFDPGGAILPPRPQFDCAIVSSGSQGWPRFSRPPEGLVLDGREHDGTLAVSERMTTCVGSRARLSHHGTPRSSRLPGSRSHRLYRSPGTPIGKSINYEPFAELQVRAELSALSGEFARPSACAFGRVFP